MALGLDVQSQALLSLQHNRQYEQGGSTLGKGGGTWPQIHLLPPSPQIQKLADRSGVISDVPKGSKIQIFRGSAPDPARGA